MCAVAEVANPGLECWGVVLANDLAVRLDGGMTRNRCPLAGVVDKANVDRLVLLQVVSLARLGVGVEEKVEAMSFLFAISNVVAARWSTAYLGG